MCKFKALQIIKEQLSKYHCRFITSQLEDGVYTIWYIDMRGNREKLITSYRYYNEKSLIDKIEREVFCYE